MRTLVSHLVGLPVVWLLSSRDSEPGALPGHDAVRVERIGLAPLSTRDLVAMARDRLGHEPDKTTRRFLDAVGGNPFLATQVIDGAGRGEPGAVPREFAAAIVQRMTRLPGAARDLAELAAVAGRPLPLADIAALRPDLSGPGLAGAIDAGLLVVAEHAVTSGDVASAQVLISAAETLASVSADDSGELALLAFRMVRPDQPEWLEPSRRCLAVLCRTQRASDAITVADLILARIEDAAAAVEYARSTGDREALTLALQAAGEAARNEGRHHIALGHFRELRSLSATPHLAEEITALQFLDRYDHAQALLDEAKADSRSNTESIVPALHAAQLWQHFYIGRFDDAETSARTLGELGQQLGNTMYALEAGIVRISMALLRGDVEGAAAHLVDDLDMGTAAS